MTPLLNFYNSSIGKKWIVALTGLVLIAYVIGHLIGNLQIFISPDQINWYGEKLHSMGLLLWVIRAFLIVCFVLHIVTTIKLAIENRQARPELYAEKKNIRTTTAARTMVMSGLILLCFVIFHLLQFTMRPASLGFPSHLLPNGHTDVYKMVVLAFQNPFAAGFYIVGMFLLCSHLSHGFSSVCQTLGLNSPKVAHTLETGGTVLAWLIFAGYTSIPVSVFLGILKI
ncbi:MAG: succinate dehydrogenase cytochrome b subunit [Chthoniobacteraceae bacterium]